MKTKWGPFPALEWILSEHASMLVDDNVKQFRDKLYGSLL
jgi:hypothetical protein